MGCAVSIYEKKGSPFWWAALPAMDEEGRERRVNVSTKIRRTDDPKKKQALAWAQLQVGAAGAGPVNEEERWANWVPDFLRRRYSANALTLRRVEYSWEWLAAWLHDLKLRVPAAVTYAHCIGYVDWRIEQRRRSGRKYSRNSANHEIGLFGLIMREAVARRFCPYNPVADIELRWDTPREKPELTDAEIALVRAECARLEGHLPIEAQWMTTSFEVALHTLCRLSSTAIPLEKIDFVAWTVELKVKGKEIGVPRWLTVPVHPALRPRLLALRAAQAVVTCQLPPTAGYEWWALRQRLGIGHTTFHSTRVTGISRLIRAGVPENIVMKLAGHGSPIVSRLYQRHHQGDLAAELAKLKLPRAAAKAGSRRRRSGGWGENARRQIQGGNRST